MYENYKWQILQKVVLIGDILELITYCNVS